MKRRRKPFYYITFVLSVVVILSGCGLFELFGKRDNSDPTKPCLELIPTATPIPIQEPVSDSETGESETSECSNGPGTAIICNGEVVVPVTVVILPKPVFEQPVELLPGNYFTITVTIELDPYYPCTGATISPSGTVDVLEGSNQSFTFSSNGSCYMVEVYIDGEPIGYQYLPFTYTFTNVTENHTIMGFFYAYGP